MVTRRRGLLRGGSKLGCLFSILIMAVLLYYGVDAGRAYLKYYRLRDEMENSARFVVGRTDEDIQRHLAAVVRDLELPPEASHFIIKRSQNPPLVTIRTQYTFTLELPFQHRKLTLRPHVEVRQ